MTATLTRPVALPPDWAAQSACTKVDPETFFPDSQPGPAAAKAVCAGCPVRRECLVAALARNERFGVWGGLTERERLNLKRRNAARKDAS